MASIKQVEDAIFALEGFRVKLVPFGNAKTALPAYDHKYMASNKWKLTEWQMVRMAPYVPFIRSLEVLRGDGRRTASDMRLGNLRDTYFAEFCGEEAARLQHEASRSAVAATDVVDLGEKRKSKAVGGRKKRP